jgi:hypothetical protein
VIGGARASLSRALDLALAALAGILAISLFVACCHDVSQGYDVWYYHLPFAARIAGIVDARAYAFSAESQARFEGFPLFAEALQGLVWRLTGRPEATSLVSLAALFALPVFLRRVFAVPLHLSLLALFAIPLVHIHATAGYIDLPANACATMLLLCTYRAVASGDARPRWLALSAALAAATANMKFQLVPIVLVASLALVIVALRHRRPLRALQGRAAVILVALPIVFATPIKNTIAHGNPVWPIELTIAGHAFPHLESAYEQSPPNLASSSRPTRFLHSILELESRPISTKRRWSIDQWAPSSDPTCRMGGYFGAYVALNLAALAWITWKERRRREVVVAAALFAGVTLVASLVPQSHELRYYMHWMLLLVSLNLVLWSQRGALARGGLGLASALALSIVVWSTDGVYLYASGSPFSVFLAKRTERAVVDSAAPGERLCIMRPPYTFLYSAPFHGRADYAVQEASEESDCKDARRVP